MSAGLTLDQKIGALLVYLATSDRTKFQVQRLLELERDPSGAISDILHECRKHLTPAMMPGYRRGGRNPLRMR